MPSPSQNGGPHARPSSPVSGRSTLTTSAPSAARIWAQYGPAIDVVTSSTRIPWSGVCTERIIARRASATMRLPVFDEFKEWVSGEWWSYAVIFAVSAIDAFFPLVPSESVVITAGNIASSGDLWLLGRHPLRERRRHRRRQHLVRDRQVGRRAHRQAALPRRRRPATASSGPSDQLETRGFYIIVIARFIPGGRTAVTFASGYTHAMPWRRFIVADICAGLLWGTYAAMLGYLGGKTFEDAPWKGLLLGFVIAVGVAVGVEVVRWYLKRRKRAGAAETAPADVD